MKSDLLKELFLKVAGDLFRERNCFFVRGELGVFSHALVVWLYISKRFNTGSLSSAREELSEILKRGSIGEFVDRPSKSLRDGTVSANTGGLCKAFNRISLEFIQTLFFESVSNIRRHFSKSGAAERSNAFVLDGLMISVSSTTDTVNGLGRCKSMNGQLHYPKVRCVTAHRVNSGLSEALAVGTVSDHENRLAEEVITQLPKGSIVVGDRCYGIVRLAQHSFDQGKTCVFRLKDGIGAKLKALQGNQNSFCWICSKKIYSCKGRIIHLTVTDPNIRSREIYLFTNCDLSDEDVCQLFLQRNQVEVAIRHVKQTLKLSFISAKTVEGVKKEIYLAFIAFNLIRALMEETANEFSICPSRLSFTSTVHIIKAHAFSLAQASPKEAKEIIECIKRQMYQTKLPNRKGSRRYPRVVKRQQMKYKNAGLIPLNN